MQKAKLFFVSGAHGVGKGYFCKRLSYAIGGDHVVVSDLIRKRRRIGIVKGISHIDLNQSILIDEINQYTTPMPFILIDGHFCLFNSEMRVKILPIELFSELGLSEIILLTCLPSTIYERIKMRDKGGAGLSEKDIVRLQRNEIEHSHRVARYLKIPITQLDVSDEEADHSLNSLLTELKRRYEL